MLLKHMDQLNLVPENKTRPKMANYVLLSFGSDGGLNQPNGTGREQIIFNGKRVGRAILGRAFSERLTQSG